MSITDELRKYANTRISPNKGMLLALADRIDAEHEAMLADARKTVYQGLIELPKDADDMPWNVGDRDEDCNVVIELRLTSSGWFVITDGELPYRPDPYSPERKRHHHAPTVEDVLREFADEMNQNLGMYTGEAIDADEWRDADAKTVEKYAAKLRLVEGEDA